MTWFSSGLSNLKEQINLLINEDENGWQNNSSGKDDSNDSRPSTKAVSKNASFVEKKKSIAIPVILPKYLNTLDTCLNDVRILKNCASDTSADLMTILEQWESAQNELETLRRERLNIKEIQPSSHGSQYDVNVEMENKILKERCNDLEVDNLNLEEALSAMKISLNQSQKETEYLREKLSNEENNNGKVLQQTTSVFCGSAFTQQIDSLILGMDEHKRQESTARKQLRDVLKSSHLKELAERYFSLIEEDGHLWEKIKMSFILPVLTDLKQSHIAEMSVSDSLKEALKPLVPVTAEIKSDIVNEQNELEEEGKENIDSENHIANGGDTNVKCNNIQFELERLRQHLLNVEQAYTSELVQSESKNKALLDEINNYEIKYNAMVESCTFNNIRMNQISESFQKDIQTLTAENENLKDTVRIYQAELQKNAQDVFNLRSALDLFHKNKDAEILQATEKVRSDVASVRRENITLQETINSLYENMKAVKEESEEKKMLLDELQAKDNEVRTLQMEVNNAQKELRNALKRIAELMTDSEAKLKTNLVKNMIFRYLTSDSPNTKLQSLRILDNVLDFSVYEKEKIGLSKTSDGILKQEKENAANDSLIDEFIKFVEKESNPNTKITKKNQQQQHDQFLYAGLTTSQSSSFSIPLPVARAYTGGSRSSSILKDALHYDEN